MSNITPTTTSTPIINTSSAAGATEEAVGMSSSGQALQQVSSPSASATASAAAVEASAAHFAHPATSSGIEGGRVADISEPAVTIPSRHEDRIPPFDLGSLQVNGIMVTTSMVDRYLATPYTENRPQMFNYIVSTVEQDLNRPLSKEEKGALHTELQERVAQYNKHYRPPSFGEYVSKKEDRTSTQQQLYRESLEYSNQALAQLSADRRAQEQQASERAAAAATARSASNSSSTSASAASAATPRSVSSAASVSAASASASYSSTAAAAAVVIGNVIDITAVMPIKKIDGAIATLLTQADALDRVEGDYKTRYAASCPVGYLFKDNYRALEARLDLDNDSFLETLPIIPLDRCRCLLRGAADCLTSAKNALQRNNQEDASYYQRLAFEHEKAAQLAKKEGELAAANLPNDRNILRKVYFILDQGLENCAPPIQDASAVYGPRSNQSIPTKIEIIRDINRIIKIQPKGYESIIGLKLKTLDCLNEASKARMEAIKDGSFKDDPRLQGKHMRDRSKDAANLDGAPPWVQIYHAYLDAARLYDRGAVPYSVTVENPHLREQLIAPGLFRQREFLHNMLHELTHK